MSLLKRQRSSYEKYDVPANLIAVKDLSKSFLDFLLEEADSMKQLFLKSGGDERLKHKILASVFYEVEFLAYEWRWRVLIWTVKRAFFNNFFIAYLSLYSHPLGLHAHFKRRCFAWAVQ
jgi:hypothetical protein